MSELYKDLFPEEVAKDIDRLGYGFLKEQGFKRTDEEYSYKKKMSINKQLRLRGLTFHEKRNYEKNGLVVFFYLKNEQGEVVAKSEGVRYEFRQSKA